MNKKWVLCPVPAYDVEGMESWLGEMEGRGWRLEKVGPQGFWATFCPCEPQRARYRLAAARKDPDLNRNYPEEEMLETYRAMGWDYVTHRGRVLVFRSHGADATELDTDPAVQALALSMVQRWQLSCLPFAFAILAERALYAREPAHRALLSSCLTAGMIPTLLVVAIYVDLLCSFVFPLLHLQGLKARLRLGEPLRHEGCDWRKGGRLYRWGQAGFLLLLVLSLGRFGLWSWQESRGQFLTPTVEFEGEVPFAPLAELTGCEVADYGVADPERYGVRTWSHLLSPVNVTWAERVEFRESDGGISYAYLYVDYHQLRWEGLARRLVKEKQWTAWDSGGMAPTAPLPGTDETAMTDPARIWPELVFRKGNTVVFARLCWLSEGEGLSLTEWAAILADSIE